MTDEPTEQVVTSGAPVIGISSYAEPATWAGGRQADASFVPRKYVDRVAAAGCVPVVLPSVSGAEYAVSRLDGLLLTGGGDIDPARYAAARHPRTAHVYPARDAAEMAFLGAALAARLPVLGICRGLQVINVFLGGTLYQHLPDRVGHKGHGPAPGQYGTQTVRMSPGSRVATAYGRETAQVPCSHHQAIDQLGEGLTATAWADDGTIEAVEAAGEAFLVAVQWHPEVSEDDSLFLALARAAQSSMAQSPATQSSMA